MREIVERLRDKRQIEMARSILESNNYRVTKENKKLNESVGSDILKVLSDYINAVLNDAESSYVQEYRTPKGNTIRSKFSYKYQKTGSHSILTAKYVVQVISDKGGVIEEYNFNNAEDYIACLMDLNSEY